MEEELSGRQAVNEGVLNEATCLSAVIILLKMGQSAVLKAIRNALTLNILLAHTSNHLGNVNRTTLGAGTNHGRHTILIRQRVVANLTRKLSGLVQNAENLVLKLGLISLSRIVIKQVLMDIEQNRLHLRLLLLNLHIHLILRGGISNQIANAHGEAVVNEELLNRALHGIQQIHRLLASVIIIGHVNNALGRLTKHRLVKLTL